MNRWSDDGSLVNCLFLGACKVNDVITYRQSVELDFEREAQEQHINNFHIVGKGYSSIKVTVTLLTYQMENSIQLQPLIQGLNDHLRLQYFQDQLKQARSSLEYF